jgi:hypothetical protein
MAISLEICRILLRSHNQNDTVKQGDFLPRMITLYHLHQLFKCFISVARS